jgi:hypothetical protein
MHRPLPDDPELRVKQIDLVLRPNPDWHRLMPEHDRLLRRDSCAVVTATMPAGSTVIARPAIETALAVNLGWRALPEGLRAATIVGERDPGMRFVVLDQRLLDLYERMRERRGVRDRELEEILPELRRLPWHSAPPAIAVFGGDLARAPRLGQRSLARLVIEWKIEAPQWRPEDLARFEAWRKEDNRLRSHEAAARRRFYGRRREQYRLEAKRIAETTQGRR